MRENPVISDWVHISGGSTEGLLGGWLAQRQAALRGMLAAGARSTRFVSSVRAVLSLSTLRATENVFWNSEWIGCIAKRSSEGVSHLINQEQVTSDVHHSDSSLALD